MLISADFLGGRLQHDDFAGHAVCSQFKAEQKFTCLPENFSIRCFVILISACLGQISSVSVLVLVNSSEVAAVPVVTDMAVKVPAHSAVPKTGSWTTSREPASLWSGDIDGKNVCPLLLKYYVVEPYMCWCNALCLSTFLSFTSLEVVRH